MWAAHPLSGEPIASSLAHLPLHVRKGGGRAGLGGRAAAVHPLWPWQGLLGLLTAQGTPRTRLTSPRWHCTKRPWGVRVCRLWAAVGCARGHARGAMQGGLVTGPGSRFTQGPAARKCWNRGNKHHSQQRSQETLALRCLNKPLPSLNTSAGQRNGKESAIYPCNRILVNLYSEGNSVPWDNVDESARGHCVQLDTEGRHL